MNPSRIVRRRPWPFVLLLGGLGSACVGSAGDLGGGSSTGTDSATPSGDTEGGPSGGADETATEGGTLGGGGTEPPPPGPPGGDACPDLGCLPCGQGLGCGEGTPLVAGTCCVEGDPLVHVATGYGSEVVDIEAQGDLVVTCGGFGATVEDVSDPNLPRVIAAMTPRCQHMTFGAALADGTQVIYLAHHGDTWVQSPFLAAYRVSEDGAFEIETIIDSEILFEGLTWRDGWLYVATHGGGLRVYSTNEFGRLTLETVVDGFDNALRPALHGDHLYVADGSGGLEVLSVVDPAQPMHVGTLPLPGVVRDVVVEGTQAYLAKGGDGVDIVDISDPTAPELEGHIETRGTAQAVAIDEEIVAIAAWSHVAVHDRSTGQLLATERTRTSSAFEQDTGVALRGRYVHVGEWEGTHQLEYFPGRVTRDIWVDDDVMSFPTDESSERVVVVRNRGYLDLLVDEIEVGGSFSADASWVQVPPQQGRAFEVAFTPPAPESGQGSLILHSDDPDSTQSPMSVLLVARDSPGLDVGDTLTEEFAFLDPAGSPDLSGLEGHVVVLAYFALF